LWHEISGFGIGQKKKKSKNKEAFAAETDELKR